MIDINEARALASECRACNYVDAQGRATLDRASTTINALADRLVEVEANLTLVTQTFDVVSAANDKLRARATAAEAKLAEVETKERLTYGQWGLTVKLYEQTKASLATATEALREAIEFADQDAQALTPAGERMIARWRTALATIKAGTAEHPDSVRLREAVEVIRPFAEARAKPTSIRVSDLIRAHLFLAKLGGTNGK